MKVIIAIMLLPLIIIGIVGSVLYHGVAIGAHFMTHLLSELFEV